jgi:glycerol uptake facilitator-like aquaporin
MRAAVVVPFLLRPFQVDLKGIGMAWGFAVALPLTMAGGVTWIE